MPRSIAKHQAFTLIDLIVVLAITTILLGILIPVAYKARTASKRVRCASNLRAIGQALHDRSIETRGYLPLAGVIRVPPSTGLDALPAALNDAARTRYVYVPHLWGAVPTQETVAPFPAALLPNLGVSDVTIDNGTLANWQSLAANRRSIEIFRCPANPVDPNRQYPHLTALQIGNATHIVSYDLPFDYALNAGLLGFDCEHETRYLRGHVTSIRDASRLVVMGDVAIRIEPLYWTPGTTPGPVSLADVLQKTPKASLSPPFDLDRHQGRMNILFADGHIEDLPIAPEPLSSALLLDR